MASRACLMNWCASDLLQAKAVRVMFMFRASFFLVPLFVALSIGAGGGCSSSDGAVRAPGSDRKDGALEDPDGGHSGSGGALGSGGLFGGGGRLFGGDASVDSGTGAHNGSGILTSIRVDPIDAVITLDGRGAIQQKFRVFGTFKDQVDEIEITDRAVFYVSENWGLGSFPADGPVFEANTGTPHGGYAVVTAIAANPDGSTLERSAGVTVRVVTTRDDPRDDGTSVFSIPADPQSLFEGPVDPARAPRVVYPNSGTLMPPNLNRLSIHFEPGIGNGLFQVEMTSRQLSVTYYLRCGPPVSGGCLFELDEAGYSMVAESNRGAEPVSIVVRGTDDSGSAVGESAPVFMQFAQDDVSGALYYWNASGDTAIMRLDFGTRDLVPEVFLTPNQDGMGNGCVGCHAISPDGRRVVASLNGQNDGQQVLVNDLTRARTDPEFLERNGQDADDEINALQFASFNPDGSRFAAVFGDTGLPARNTLWFHDGQTGTRLAGDELVFEFEPDHPDWSADGNRILVTRVGVHNTSQKPYNCGISMVDHDGAAWSPPVDVLPVIDGDGKTRFNPNLLPDDQLFVFSESTCDSPGQEQSQSCNGDADPSATTWAAIPEENTTPVHLVRAGAPGLMDNGQTKLSDTFPRSAPFESHYLSKDTALDVGVVRPAIFWVTIATVRRIGLLNSDGQRQLWMFAVDPAKVLAGEDGSFPAFHLPFQDPQTSNHIGEWTQSLVSDTPPPDPPAPPPPPPPPVPPGLE